MASMSYCCIENAAGDLAEAVCKFKNRQEDVQSNPYEKACLENLYELCKEFVDAYEEYDDDPEDYIKHHSNTDAYDI
ncbi:MAG: hypothetical protein KBT34_03205 [Prevotella sp.]|nr:hypothetical protein [Candidatus Prevotella equi]